MGRDNFLIAIVVHVGAKTVAFAVDEIAGDPVVFSAHDVARSIVAAKIIAGAITTIPFAHDVVTDFFGIDAGIDTVVGKRQIQRVDKLFGFLVKRKGCGLSSGGSGVIDARVRMNSDARLSADTRPSTRTRTGIGVGTS